MLHDSGLGDVVRFWLGGDELDDEPDLTDDELDDDELDDGDDGDDGDDELEESCADCGRLDCPGDCELDDDGDDGEL